MYDSSGGEHKTTLGYYGEVDFLVAQTKGLSYLEQYAAHSVSDGSGTYSGSAWTAINGLNQGPGGFVPPTNCMTQGVFPYSSNLNNVICNAYSGPDRTQISGSVYQTLIGAAVPGQGAALTANLYGKSGYLDTFVGIEGQYGSEQASARVEVNIDGASVLNQTFGGLTRIQVPFTHAQAGEIDVTVDSPYPSAPRISNTNWFVWDDAAWNGVSPSDPLIPDGAKILLLMDSMGTWDNNAFATRLQQDLPASSITNVSVPGKTSSWAIQNFSALTEGGPYDYIISDFQINDLHASTQGSLTYAELLNNIETLWNLVLQTGATPIYVRSLFVPSMAEDERLSEWDQTLTADYPVQTLAQQPQTITFPNPGTQIYGVGPIPLTATASSGLAVTYTVLSGPATASGGVLTISGAGSVTVQANQSGNQQWQAAPPVNDTFTVTPAVLTVTAGNASMSYGGTLPTFGASYSGFVNGDGQGVLSGSPSLTTTATSNSPVGNYAITAAQGTLSALNYTFTFVNGTLTIMPAPSSTSLTSAVNTLYGSQATTLTALASVTGSGGAPTGTVSFMLGSTLIGTATLVTVDGTDASATLQLLGSQLNIGPNSIRAAYSGDTNYQGSSSTAITLTLLSSAYAFGMQNLGTQSSSLTLNYSFAQNTQLTAIDILTQGAANLDFEDAGTSTCQIGVPYTVGQACSVTVSFTPSAPGLRPGAVAMFAQGSNLPLMTWYLSGVGTSAGVTIDPGTEVNLAAITNGAPYGSAVDGAGNVYVADQANGQVVEIAAGTQALTVVASQLLAPTSVALDGAGNLYVAETSGVAMVPNENGTLNASDLVTLNIPGLGLPQGIAIDGSGNLLVADSEAGDVLEMLGGTGLPQTVVTGLTNPHSVALDAVGNVYVSSDNQVSEYSVGGGTEIPLGSGYSMPQSVTVDASGTVYVADTGNAQIVKVAPGGTSQAVLPVAGLVAPHGVTLDANGDIYVSDGNNVYEVNRTQAALNFGQVQEGNVSPPQTLSVTNMGNEQLTLSGLTITANYQQQASGGSDCSGNSHLGSGVTCAIAVAFAPTAAGVLNGAVTLTDNALNNPASRQSVSLTGTGITQQQPQTITFPNPGTQTYGAGPITLTATASSGLPVSYAIISGPAAVSGSVLSINGAGTVTVQASQAGNDQWLPAAPVNDTFTVNPALLTVTANNASMTYGANLPVFTAGYSGFVNGDGQGVLTGAPSLTTTASSNSPVGNYAITATQGTLWAQNYTFTFVNGTLTITQAHTSISWSPETYSLHAGQELGPAGVLDAAVVPSIPGVMRYTTALHGHIVALLSNMVLPVGQYPITAAFTPQDNNDYATPTSLTVTIMVTQ